MTHGTDIRDQRLAVRDRRSEITHHASYRLGRSTIDDQPSTDSKVALLTGGGDKPYALGLATVLAAEGVLLDFIGSNDLSAPEVLDNPRVNFLNLRGDQSREASLPIKIGRVAVYYWRLIHYAAAAKPKVFHIL